MSLLDNVRCVYLNMFNVFMLFNYLVHFESILEYGIPDVKLHICSIPLLL